MFNEELFDALCKEIPNLSEHYTKEEVFAIMSDVDTNINEVVDDFMYEVWEEPMRRCDVCGKLMYTGYYLNGVYACDDACRNEYYKKCCSCETDEDVEREYLMDYIGCLDEEEVYKLSLEELREYAEEYGGEGEFYYTEWE